MRRITMLNRIALDGYYAGPNGEIDWFIHDNAVVVIYTLCFRLRFFRHVSTYRVLGGFLRGDRHCGRECPSHLP